MYFSAKQLADAYTARFGQPGTVDLKAGADPDFGGEKVEGIQAAGVLSFNGNTKNVKVLEPFMVLGNVVIPGTEDRPTIVELPSEDAKYVINVGKGVEASDADIAAAQKAK